MRFKKIKYDKGKIRLEYEVKNKNGGWDEFSLACADEPKPEFQETLQALKEDVIEMCELPEDYLSRIRVTGVSFSYGGDDEIMGATVISQMILHHSNVALNLNTPHKPSAPYSESGDETQLLSDNCIDHLGCLEREAKEYIQGIRVQGNLFNLKAGESVTISSPGHKPAPIGSKKRNRKKMEARV
jgi:hypothetical protein